MNPSAHPSDFFVAGGTLQYDAPSYIERPSDAQLLQLASSGQLCYVLTTRQMGKSSLMNRIAQQLRLQGQPVALIDLTSIGQTEAETWYLSLLDDLATQLQLPLDLEAWWHTQQHLSSVRRFTKFIQEVVLTHCSGKLAIFIDEVDSALQLPFSDDFFAAVRAIHNQSLMSTSAGRLALVLLGVAAPNDLIKESQRTPFNVGERLQLQELPLPALEAAWAEQLPQALLARIYAWTSGHPYLTQKIARALVLEGKHTESPEAVDRLVQTLFFSERAVIEDSNLQFIRGRMQNTPRRVPLLHLYNRVLRGRSVLNDEHNPLHTELKLYGLVKVAADGRLVVRNPIYAQTFNRDWIARELNLRRTRIRQLLLALLLLLILGGALAFWQQSRQTEALLAESYRTTFLTTENPTLRLDNLASLLALDGYREEGIALFSQLSTAEQIALFEAVTPDLESQTQTTIAALYQSFAPSSLGQPAESSQVLAAMLTALETTQSGETTLSAEIRSWLEGRQAALRGDYDGARIAFSVVLSLNPDNQPARFERALTQVALGQLPAASQDLNRLLEANPAWEPLLEQLLAEEPALVAVVLAENGALAALVAQTPVQATAVPSPIITVEPSPTQTPERAPVSATPPPSEANPAPTAQPELGTAPPQGLIVYTCFDGQIDQICTLTFEDNGVVQRQLTEANATAWYASASAITQSIFYSSLETGRFTVVRIDLNGENMSRPISSNGGDFAPALAPDGSLIVFTRALEGRQQIWLANADGSNPRPLTDLPGDALDPVWSPDGMQVVFAYQPPGAAEFEPWISDVSGGEQRPLAIPLEQIGGRTDWSPDGRWLALYAGPPGRHDIYLFALDGSALYHLTNIGDNLAPAFSPDGEWLVFTSSRDGDNELFMMRLDGSELTQLTDNTLSDWQPRWMR